MIRRIEFDETPFERCWMCSVEFNEMAWMLATDEIGYDTIGDENDFDAIRYAWK